MYYVFLRFLIEVLLGIENGEWILKAGEILLELCPGLIFVSSTLKHSKMH